MRHDDEFAFTKLDLTLVVAIEVLDSQLALHDQEQFVFAIVMVPHKLAFHLDELDVGIVHFADKLGRVVIGEEGEFLREVHLVHAGSDDAIFRSDDEFSASCADPKLFADRESPYGERRSAFYGRRRREEPETFARQFIQVAEMFDNGNSSSQ